MRSDAARIRIRFDGRVGSVIGAREGSAMVVPGSPFVFALLTLFQEHPRLSGCFPPGCLALLVNGRPPDVDTCLSDGDVIEIVAHAEALAA